MMKPGFLLVFLRIIIIVDCTTPIRSIDSAIYVPMNSTNVLLYNRTYYECICLAFFSSISSPYQVLSFFKNNNTCLLSTHSLSRSDIRINTNSKIAYLPPPLNTAAGNYFSYT
jgi:hypothetical protein